MKPRKRRRPPRTSVLLAGLIAAIAAATLLLCAGLFLRSYRRAIVQQAGTANAQAVTQVVGTVENYLTTLDEAVAVVVDRMDEPAAERDAFLQAFLIARPEVVAVTSYDAQGNLQDCWSNGLTRKQTIVRNLSFDQQTAEQHPEGYVSAPHVESIFAGYYPWVVTIVSRMDAPDMEWLAVDLRFSQLAAAINNVSIGQHGYCFLMNDEGSMVYHPQQQLLYAGLKTEDVDRLATLDDGTYVEDTQIYTVQCIQGSAWRAVGVSYIDETVNESYALMVRIVIGTALLILALALAAALVLSRLVSRPLMRLEAAMQLFEQDAEHFVYAPQRGTREVESLSDSFTHMVGRIRTLMQTVREEEITLRKTELKALQAQINPHFLYNTLDSIAWMCERGKNADAVQMVHALARLFRISISRGHELIPIEKELQHAEAYLQIQKYRYKNQFTYHFTVDESCTQYLCNKITLQPIIENAITHGLDLMVEPGHIEIEVLRDGGDILFKVTDDGIGMPPEQVAALLQSEPSDRTGIGIKNVNDRLRIYFGAGYGLSIESTPDVGTTVTIRMPQVEPDREGDYDKAH